MPFSQTRASELSLKIPTIFPRYRLPRLPWVDLQKFEMNTTTWEATTGAGTLFRDVTKRLNDAGRCAIAHGTCPQVGTGGG